MSEEGMSCALCRLARTACDRKLPCERCVRLNLAHRCFLPPPCKRGRPPRQASPAAGETPVKILPQQQVPNDAPPAASVVSGLPAAYTPQPQPQLPPQSPAPAQQQGTKRRLGADGAISAEDGAAGLSGRTTAFLVDTIAGLKEDMRAMADQMRRMQKKISKNAKQCKEHHQHQHQHHQHHGRHHDDEQGGQSTHQVLRQLQRRVAQLEEDNSQLRNQLAHIAASRYGICARPAATSTALAATTFTSADTSSPSSSSTSPSSSPPDLAWAMGDSFQGMRVMGDGAGAPAEMGTGLGREMLWCFPFLRHFDFSSRRFVVDDLQKAVLVLRVHQPGPTNRASSSAVFANHQFCHISGFSMAELLGREIVWVTSRNDKRKLLDAWRNGSRVGFSEIVSCYHQMEYKGGNFATVLSRSQFFFSADEKHTPRLAYSVHCVEQVLGVESLPYSVEEAQRKERAEWKDVQQAVAGQTPSLALRPPTAVDHQPLALRTTLQSPELEARAATGDAGHHAPPADVAAFGGSWHDFLLPDDLDTTTQTDYSAFGFSSAASPLSPFFFPPGL